MNASRQAVAIGGLQRIIGQRDVFFMELLGIATQSYVWSIAVHRRVAINMSVIMTVATATAALSIILTRLSHQDKLSFLLK